MSLLTQALTFGLAAASISAFGRRRRMVMVFDVTHVLYHALPGCAMGFRAPYEPGAHRDTATSDSNYFTLR